MSDHEKQGTGYDPGARGHELAGREATPAEVAVLQEAVGDMEIVGKPMVQRLAPGALIEGTLTGPEEPIGTALGIEDVERGQAWLKAQPSAFDSGPGQPTTDAAAVSRAMPPVENIAYLVIDCETSGLPLYTEKIDGKSVTVAADDPRQPYLAQLCMISLDEDLRTLDLYAGYVKPDGWVMEPGATAANGLTTEFLLEHGLPVTEVLDAYEARLARGPVLVAHNAQFDAKIMRGALRRAGRSDHFEETHQFCTMREWATAHHTKWPKLIDLCTMLGIEHEGPHKAIADAKATVQLLPHFRRLGIAIDGRVHRSKYHPGREET